MEGSLTHNSRPKHWLGPANLNLESFQGILREEFVNLLKQVAGRKLSGSER